MDIFLGVNIDHIATLREARGTSYPSPVEGALICESAGADSITLHLREDRRHIKDHDVLELRDRLTTKMNLEIATTEEMVSIACDIQPKDCCLVPEKRQELTTEGGLDVFSQVSRMKEVCARLAESNVTVSLFIDAQKKQIDSAMECGAPVIEIHTGHYADAMDGDDMESELERIKDMAKYAKSIGLQVNAGHGLTIENTAPVAELREIVELNIGHSIISRAVFIGLEGAVREMKDLMLKSRSAK
ncbi:MAG: pyridoxine 5'-phosphate synthase [PS1 clade bacterium]|jgi:pyridoxine 5-phosphate synthase|tara:strand:+ start:58 stop:792 length:735 start_codon:yes stop_codon:yes gene_type:complete